MTGWHYWNRMALLELVEKYANADLFRGLGRWPLQRLMELEAEAKVAAAHHERSTERVNEEIKRRANVIGIFPNDGAIIGLVGALVVQQTEDCHLTRRYMSQESLVKVFRSEAAQELFQAKVVA